jgi:BirA family biotin operon repressor/biotin-[acetyl-CoA-carboxylase] ligase
VAKIAHENLIKALANGEFVSGQLLAQQLNVTRASISKYISILKGMGLDIYSVKGKGYKFATPLNLLSSQKISSLIGTDVNTPEIEVHNIIDSTNNYLLRRLPNSVSQGQVCLAEYQDAGRGRRGRKWISPFGSQIYLSMYWRLSQGLSSAMGLSLVTAIALSDAIKKVCDIEVQLKWPNDVYIQGVKVAGILIDLEGQPLEESHSVIGVGLNIDMPSIAGAEIDQAWTDLSTHCHKPIDRNAISAALISALWQRLAEHEEHGISNMLDEWHHQDLYLNKQVKLLTGENIAKGICKGVNQQGALLLEVNGQIKTIYGGEVSLRGDS